jgi:hypothetical protein
MSFREQELEKRYPTIPWRQPIKLGSLSEGSVTLWGCRYCISLHGLTHSGMSTHPTTYKEFKEHMEKEHGVTLSLHDVIDGI